MKWVLLKRFHIVSLDLFEYDKQQYLTIMDVFSRMPFVYSIEDKTADAVNGAYESWISTFNKPTHILCDNGGEFEGIQSDKLTTPSNHPQANSILERFHKELAVMCRVHNCTPDVAVKFLRSHQSKLVFFSALKIKFSDSTACPLVHKERVFHGDELVWRHIPRRSRKKHEDVFTGPHRVLKKMGRYAYKIFSSKAISRTLKVNVNDIKKFVIPDNSKWILNPKFLNPAKAQLNSENEPVALLDFAKLETFTLDSIGKGVTSKLFVIPDWPCMSWYKPLHDFIEAEAVQLPDKPDLFLDENGNAIGSLAWKHWLFSCK